jgi:hypothetical protein
MFTSSNFYNFSTPVHAGNSHTDMVRAALDLYRLAQIKGWLGRRLGALKGDCTCLVNLERLEAEGKAVKRRYAGLRSVPLSQICGSEGRTRDFDRHFNPLRSHTQQRWLNVMLARRLDVPLPPVELIQIGDAYFVRDGHHRVSVAHALGEVCIDAEVTLWELAEATALSRAAKPATVISVA